MKSARKRPTHHNPFQEDALVKSELFQELMKVLKKESIHLMDEMKVEHVSIFYDWINSKLRCIDETLKLGQLTSS